MVTGTFFPFKPGSLPVHVLFYGTIVLPSSAPLRGCSVTCGFQPSSRGLRSPLRTSSKKECLESSLGTRTWKSEIWTLRYLKTTNSVGQTPWNNAVGVLYLRQTYPSRKELLRREYVGRRKFTYWVVDDELVRVTVPWGEVFRRVSVFNGRRKEKKIKKCTNIGFESNRKIFSGKKPDRTTEYGH